MLPLPCSHRWLPGTGDPTSITDAIAAIGNEHLFVWGDHIGTSATWVRVRQGLDAYRDALREAGVVVDELDLPALGICGNSHMLMMDTNSDVVAALLHGWMAKQGLTNG